MDAHVEWPETGLEDGLGLKAKILDASLDWTGAELVSSIARGTLLISGALYKVIFKPNDSLLGDGVNICDIWPSDKRIGQRETRNTVTKPIGACILDGELPTTQIWCLQICTRGLGGFSYGEWVDDVLLLVLTGLEPYQYQRIGVGQIDVESGTFHGISNVQVTLV